MQHFPFRFKAICDEKAIARTLISLLRENAPVIISDSAIASIAQFHQDASVCIEVRASLRHYSDLESTL